MAIQILTIQPRMDVTPTGELIPIYHIRFRTERGAIGVVTIPQSDFDPDKVRELVRERAAQLDSIYEI
jgi:hypothetical protein